MQFFFLFGYIYIVKRTDFYHDASVPSGPSWDQRNWIAVASGFESLALLHNSWVIVVIYRVMNAVEILPLLISVVIRVVTLDNNLEIQWHDYAIRVFRGVIYVNLKLVVDMQVRCGVQLLTSVCNCDRDICAEKRHDGLNRTRVVTRK